MEEKYTIIKNGMDDYTLKYKDKEIKLRSCVHIAERLQDAIKVARIKLIKDLTKEGITVNELTKKTSVDGKTYYDNSNKDELEKIYIAEEQQAEFDRAVKEVSGHSFTELVLDIGLQTEEEAQKFGEAISGIITAQTPR